MANILALLAVNLCAIWGIRIGIRRFRERASPKHIGVKPKQPGFIMTLYDENRPELLRIVGSRTDRSTTLEKKCVIESADYPVELKAIQQQLAKFKVTGDWYDRDATTMYFDSRMGQA